jgi:hypothetical protein
VTTYSDLAAALKTQVEGVATIGNVYAYHRVKADWAEFLTLFTTGAAADTRARGWYITMNQPVIETRVSEFGTRDRVYRFLLTGIEGLDDAANTESILIQHVEGILDALDDETTFGVAGVIVRGFDVQCRTVEHRTFGGVLCNVAEITIDIPVEKVFS